MKDLVDKLRYQAGAMGTRCSSVPSIMLQAADAIEILTAPDVDNKSFWHCLDRLQEQIDSGSEIKVYNGLYQLYTDGGHFVASGKSIRELLLNLVLIN